MQRRGFLIFILLFVLVACQPKNVEITETKDVVAVEKAVFETDVKQGPAPVCPAFTTLKDGQCLCNDQAVKLADASTWMCVDDTWMCFTVGGCHYARGVCGFGEYCDRQECSVGEHCTDDARCDNYDPSKPTYDKDFELQNGQWICNQTKGCRCGDIANADICRRFCMRSDDTGRCLEEKWFAQFLPICDGPYGIGHGDRCVDSCSGICNGFGKPKNPGYGCDNRAWVCRDEACICGLTLCPKGHYCIGGMHCSR